VLRDTDYVLQKLDWMRAERIWPNGLRYLWTDAFGVVLYISLYRELREQRWLDAAESLIADVERVLGRPRGIRIGEAPDRDGQSGWYRDRSDYRARCIVLASVRGNNAPCASVIDLMPHEAHERLHANPHPSAPP
jgi:hypothetical protein